MVLIYPNTKQYTGLVYPNTNNIVHVLVCVNLQFQTGAGRGRSYDQHQDHQGGPEAYRPYRQVSKPPAAW